MIIEYLWSSRSYNRESSCIIESRDHSIRSTSPLIAILWSEVCPSTIGEFESIPTIWSTREPCIVGEGECSWWHRRSSPLGIPESIRRCENSTDLSSSRTQADRSSDSKISSYRYISVDRGCQILRPVIRNDVDSAISRRFDIYILIWLTTIIIESIWGEECSVRIMIDSHGTICVDLANCMNRTTDIELGSRSSSTDTEIPSDTRIPSYTDIPSYTSMFSQETYNRKITIIVNTSDGIRRTSEIIESYVISRIITISSCADIEDSIVWTPRDHIVKYRMLRSCRCILQIDTPVCLSDISSYVELCSWSICSDTEISILEQSHLF